MDPVRLKARASFEALARGDAEAYAACFLPEGIQEGPMGGVLQGREALQGFVRDLTSRLGLPAFTEDGYFTRGSEVALAWTGVAGAGGGELRFPGISHWSHAPSGHIRHLRIFHDLPARLVGAARPLPPLVQAWMAALDAGDPATLSALLAPDAEMDGMVSGGTLRGAPVLARHLAHVLKMNGSPRFHLEASFELDGQLALRWVGVTTSRTFKGITLLTSGDGQRVEVLRQFWGAEAASGDGGGEAS